MYIYMYIYVCVYIYIYIYIYMVGQKVHSGFSIASYGKTQTNFWATQYTYVCVCVYIHLKSSCMSPLLYRTPHPPPGFSFK